MKTIFKIIFFLVLFLNSACSNSSPNKAPIADAGSNLSVDEGIAVTLNGNGVDPDGNITSFSWVQISGQDVVLSNPNSDITEFIAPDISETITLVFQLTVGDNDGEYSTDRLTITVNPTGANNVPVADAGVNQSVIPGATVSLVGIGEDSDGEISAYSWIQLSGGTVVLSDSNSAATTFNAPEDEGILVFEFTVIDNEGAQGVDVISINVSHNIPPLAEASFDQLVISGNLVTLFGKGSDSDGTINNYKWEQLSGDSVTLLNYNDAITTFRAPEVTQNLDLEFKLTVTDSNGDTDSDIVKITVEPLDYTTYEVPRVASRSVGVAPLSVFFSAGFSNSSSDYRDFHDLEYSWDFGDISSEVWGTSGKSKRYEKGPVVSHLFESPGLYSVSLSVKNEFGIVIDTSSFSIMVIDPDDIFLADRTICISDLKNDDFEGCPSGAIQISTDDISEIADYAGSGKRILLNRGSSWTSLVSTPIPEKIVTLQIGAYGLCQTPSTQGICSNAPEINLIGSSPFISLKNHHDLRIMDINFIGEATTEGVISGTIDIQQLLIARVSTQGFNSSIGWSHWRERATDRIAENSIISCNLSRTEEYPVFIGGEKLSLMGNIISDSKTTHSSRVWFAYQGVISHNYISGASYGNLKGRHALKLHGPKENMVGSFTESEGAGLPFRTKFVMIKNNIFGGSGPWPVSIGPQDSFSDERLSDIIIEKNKMSAQFGTQNDTPVQVGLMFEGRYMTARNNIIDGTGGANEYSGIYIAQRGVEPSPLGNRVYNNTIYNNDNTVNGSIGIKIEGSASDTIVRNNFVSFPGTSIQTLIEDLSNNSNLDHNLLDNNNGFVDPNNTNPLLRDFSLLASSPAINEGTIVPVLDDFLGQDRTQDIYDLGAFYFLQ